MRKDDTIEGLIKLGIALGIVALAHHLLDHGSL